jgi:hypothetical protein
LVAVAEAIANFHEGLKLPALIVLDLGDGIVDASGAGTGLR